MQFVCVLLVNQQPQQNCFFRQILFVAFESSSTFRLDFQYVQFHCSFHISPFIFFESDTNIRIDFLKDYYMQLDFKSFGMAWRKFSSATNLYSKVCYVPTDNIYTESREGVLHEQQKHLSIFYASPANVRADRFNFEL